MKQQNPNYYPRLEFKLNTGIVSYSLGIGLSVISVFAGGLIYVFFRSSNIIFFQWIKSTGLDSTISILRENWVLPGAGFPDWFVYSLPNGLWAFAYSILITIIWANKKSLIKYFWLGTIPLLIFGFEALQYFHVIPGTFSGLDLLFGALGIITGIWVGFNLIKRIDNEEIYI